MFRSVQALLYLERKIIDLSTTYVTFILLAYSVSLKNKIAEHISKLLVIFQCTSRSTAIGVCSCKYCQHIHDHLPTVSVREQLDQGQSCQKERASRFVKPDRKYYCAMLQICGTQKKKKKSKPRLVQPQ